MSLVAESSMMIQWTQRCLHGNHNAIGLKYRGRGFLGLSLKKSRVSDVTRGRSLGRSVLQYTWRLTAAVSLWETSSTAADCNLLIWMLLIDREFVSVSLVSVLLMYYLVSSLHNDLFFLCLLCIKPLSWEPNHQQYNCWSGMQEKLNILIQTI